MTRFNFRKQESNRYVRVSRSYRRPRGFHSKMREHRKGNLRLPEAGFRAQADVRGLHPCGLRETLVFNESMLASVDPKLYAIRISANVAHPRKMKIADGAKKLGLKVLNPPKAIRPEARDEKKKKEAARAEAEKPKAEAAKAEGEANKPGAIETPKETKTGAGSKAPVKKHSTPVKRKKSADAGGGGAVK